MKKRITAIVVIAVMLFGVFGLTACNNDLADYKATAKTTIESYAVAEGYSTANWAVVLERIKVGKGAVEAATTKPQVDTAVNEAKEAIDMVSRKLKGELVLNGEPAPPIWTAFTSEESRIKVGEDLTVKLFYASQSDYNSIYVYDPAPISVSAKIIMGNGIYTRRLLQKGEHTYSNPEYVFDYERIEEFTLKEINNFANTNDYPVAGSSVVASETIVIPADWFVGEMGAIVWSVTANLVWAEEAEIVPETRGGGITLYYRIEGDNIALFDSYYKFFNDIRN